MSPPAADTVVNGTPPASPRLSPVRAADLLQRLFDHTQVILWAIDAEGVFTLSEGRGLEALGLKPGEVVGKSAMTMYADHPGVSSLLRQVLGGRESHTIMAIGEAWFETWVQPLHDDAGRVTGAVGVSTDVSDRVRSERQLKSLNAQLAESVQIQNELLDRASRSLEEQILERHRTYRDLERSEARWRSLVEHAADVILQIDRSGIIEYINHPTSRDSRTVEDVLGRSAYEFLFPEFAVELREALAVVFEKGQSISVVVSGPTGTGEKCWYQGHFAPLRHEGRIVSATVIVRDITDERRSAEELRQKQDQLAHVARVSMVGEMTASFAHELNQPLAAIAHYIAGCLIRLKKVGLTDPSVLSTLEDAASEARRASEVVRRLRLFLQRNDMVREPADFNQIVLDAIKLIDSTLGNFEVQCEADLAADLPELFVDRIQLMQVLLNLLLNSAEAMAESSIEPRLILIRTRHTHPGRVLCTIRDQGPGLPTGLPQDIFDAFITTKPDGLGLGLSISRSIVVAHGGTIRAVNHPDGGAEFTLSLPISA
jgi:PAS domain S-box-containing protein